MKSGLTMANRAEGDRRQEEALLIREQYSSKGNKRRRYTVTCNPSGLAGRLFAGWAFFTNWRSLQLGLSTLVIPSTNRPTNRD
jgi:hypothetical protein